MLSKTVLVKNITNLSEARYCAGMGVEYLAFDFNPSSPDFVERKAFDEIRNWVTGVKILGIPEPGHITGLESWMTELGLDGLLTENEDILQAGLEGVLFQAELSDHFLEDKLNIYAGLAEHFVLVSTQYSDEDIARTNALAGRFPVLAGFDIDLTLLERFPEAGFAFSGTKEERPGFNHYDELMEKLESLESDF